MKINQMIETPKIDFEDYSKSEQQLMKLMSSVQGNCQTDYMGAEKAITIRANVNNAPKIDALAELSGLSKNIVINELLELAFLVLKDNLGESDALKFQQTESQKFQEWMSKIGGK